MRLRALQSFFILVLITGMGFAGIAPAQVAPGATPKSQAKPEEHSNSAVDLSQKNVLVLHGLESNVPIFESTDRGIKTVLDSGGVGARNQFFEYLDLVRNPEPEHRILLAEFMLGRPRLSWTRIYGSDSVPVPPILKRS